MEISQSQESAKQNSRKNPVLLATAFLVSTIMGLLLVALPYHAQQLGGTPADVGLLGGVFPIFYVLGMTVSRSLYDRWHPRTLIIISCALSASVTIVMGFSGTLTVLWCAQAIYGWSTAWFWPPLMGWFTSGYDGVELNRQVGRYTSTCSIGLIIGPVLGGWLFEITVILPFVTGGLLYMVCALLLWSLVPLPVTCAQQQESSSGSVDPHRAALFRSLARVSLFCAFVCTGLLRFQLPNLASEMGISAGGYGPIGTALSVSMGVGFIMLGKTVAWQYRTWLMWTLQCALGLFLLIAYVAQEATALVLCVILAGPCVSFAYVSHMFYGVTGRPDRQSLMAVHETILAIGFLVGSFGAGLVADQTDNRFPYLLGCGVMLLGVMVKVIIKLSFNKSTQVNS